MLSFDDKVQITRQDGSRDPWSTPEEGKSNAYDCRIEYGSRLIRNQFGQEVISNEHIYFPGYVNVGYADELSWIDLSVKERTSKPASIEVIKDLDNIPRMTVVDL
ncbi:hypothetical protein [Paenibacillus lutimineralis]|uniref:Uncharacterized protein n=1 Tax=Paenibacillus lutimineralis TaxID=2707005 RepID=A0A3Q9IEQ2_9BACL|nr:hypothetical protein [Paenibacillus lutimineralis]AZS17394.1 hypothetical protein EI981_25215 [Paenibacillus lutimineralis]